MEKVLLVLFVLQDGSQINAELQTKEISVKTKYGVLSVPIADIYHIDIGLHYPEGMKDKVDKLLADLSSPTWKVRELSTQELTELGRYAYHVVLAGLESDNLEFKKRCEKILPKIAGTKQEAGDVLHLVDGWTIAGQIAPDLIIGKNETLGDVKLAPYMISKIIVTPNKTINIDVKGEDIWQDTGIDLSKYGCKIVSRGTIDLWGQQPGQYTTGPNGHVTIGLDGFRAGALIGKVGKEEFIVGEYCEVRKTGGRLFLKIAKTPWNGALIEGKYNVDIKRYLPTTPK